MTPIVWGLALSLCMPAWAKSSHRHGHRSHGGNCVAYARAVTGIALDGNAGTWWTHAKGRYDRGHQPAPGAILVFKPHGRMRLGHVAIVSRIVGPREILVDQANWVRGHVTKAMSVVDASPDNDWTVVKVIEPHSGKHGRDNPTFGFIYAGLRGREGDPLFAAVKHAHEPRHPHAKVAVLTNFAAHRTRAKHRRQTSQAARPHTPAAHAAIAVTTTPDRRGHRRSDKRIVFY